MAQHRTKQDKQAAQQHRMEHAKTYSLSSLEDSKVDKTAVPKNSTIEQVGIQMKYVRADLIRTVISIVVVVLLLAAGTYYLG